MSNEQSRNPDAMPKFVDVVSIRVLFRSTIGYNEGHIGTIRKT